MTDYTLMLRVQRDPPFSFCHFLGVTTTEKEYGEHLYSGWMDTSSPGGQLGSRRPTRSEKRLWVPAAGAAWLPPWGSAPRSASPGAQAGAPRRGPAPARVAARPARTDRAPPPGPGPPRAAGLTVPAPGPRPPGPRPRPAPPPARSAADLSREATRGGSRSPTAAGRSAVAAVSGLSAATLRRKPSRVLRR